MCKCAKKLCAHGSCGCVQSESACTSECAACTAETCQNEYGHERALLARAYAPGDRAYAVQERLYADHDRTRADQERARYERARDKARQDQDNAHAAAAAAYDDDDDSDAEPDDNSDYEEASDDDDEKVRVAHGRPALPAASAVHLYAFDCGKSQCNLVTWAGAGGNTRGLVLDTGGKTKLHLKTLLKLAPARCDVLVSHSDEDHCGASCPALMSRLAPTSTLHYHVSTNGANATSRVATVVAALG